MARTIDKQTKELIKDYILEVRKKFKPEKIILFGSRARGDNLKTSDIDILVVSEKFEGVNFRDRLSDLYGNWDKKEDLDSIGLTPKEFEKRKNELSIIGKAYREGIEI